GGGERARRGQGAGGRHDRRAPRRGRAGAHRAAVGRAPGCRRTPDRHVASPIAAQGRVGFSRLARGKLDGISFLKGPATPLGLAVAMALAGGSGQALGRSHSPTPRTDSIFSSNPAVVQDWENRLLENDPKAPATAEAALAHGAGRSLPLLRRFLTPEHEDLHA